MSAVYAYYAFDLVTGAIISEVPLRGAQPTWQVNDPGSLGSPSINVSDMSAVQLSDVRASTVPWKCGIAVDRDGTIIWSGIVTARRYASSGHTYALTVPGLMEYWRRRFIATNLTWYGTDQIDIVTSLLATGGDPTVPLMMQPDLSGVLRDRTIAAGDFKAVLDEILQIADNINGFELAVDTSWDTTPGVQRVVHALRIASPRLGRVYTGGDLLTLESPGNVRNYTWDEDGTQFATNIYGSSTDTSGVTVTQIAQNATLLALGFPQVGTAVQWSNITNTDTLANHVIQAVADAAGYQDAPTFLCRDEGDTAAGSWTVGDDVRLRVTDDRRFPVLDGSLGPGLDVVVRLASATVDPIAETVALTAFGFTQAVQ